MVVIVFILFVPICFFFDLRCGSFYRIIFSGWSRHRKASKAHHPCTIRRKTPSRYAARAFEFCEAFFQSMSFFFTGVLPVIITKRDFEEEWLTTCDDFLPS